MWVAPRREKDLTPNNMQTLTSGGALGGDDRASVAQIYRCLCEHMGVIREVITRMGAPKTKRCAFSDTFSGLAWGDAESGRKRTDTHLGLGGAQGFFDEHGIDHRKLCGSLGHTAISKLTVPSIVWECDTSPKRMRQNAEHNPGGICLRSKTHSIAGQEDVS